MILQGKEMGERGQRMCVESPVCFHSFNQTMLSSWLRAHSLHPIHSSISKGWDMHNRKEEERVSRL